MPSYIRASFRKYSKTIFSNVKTYIENKVKLSKTPSKEHLSVNSLLPSSRISKSRIFTNDSINHSFAVSKAEIEKILRYENIPRMINPGDRKAIYYLISFFKPRKVLETGTFLGASTIHIAASLKRLFGNDNSSLTTVDIENVNSKQFEPALFLKRKSTPEEMIKKINYTDINFETYSSLDYLQNTKEKFDLVFLDSNHASDFVYKEIKLSLKILNAQGVIIVHDFYPDGKPLFPTGKIIWGPYLAVKKLMKENQGLEVIPLGKLPWKTKENSYNSSLAILSRKDCQL